MSTSKKEAIKNAGSVIECFGGIRPMAKKMDVAVTTVQGWKKRDVIPGARREQVLAAAAQYDIDLSGVLGDLLDEADIANQSDVPVKETVKAASPVAAKPEVKADAKVVKAAPVVAPKAEKPSAVKSSSVTVDKNAVVFAVLIMLGIAAAVTLFWPSEKEEDASAERLAALEQEVEAVQERQSFFGTLIPEDLNNQLSALQEQAGQARVVAGQVLGKAQEVSNDVLAEGAGTVDQRMEKLSAHASEIMANPSMAGFAQKIGALRGQEDGQLQLDIVMSELGALMGVAKQEAALEQAMVAEGEPVDPSAHEDIFENLLLSAKGTSSALGQTFEGVPADDVKAAALLLTMSQFRTSLNRDNEAFDNDLKVLKGLIGDDNIELNAALERLAPHAKEGVLTPAGLSSEFKSLAGDAVVASLSGEEVSIKERTSARMNELFQVEKDGELITGTSTQSTLAKAESLLAEGDLEAAISATQGLDGDAGAVMEQWLDKARVRLMVENIQKMLKDNIDVQALGAGAAGAAKDITARGAGAAGTLVRDEETGINVLVPSSDKSGFIDMPDMPADANPFN